MPPKAGPRSGVSTGTKRKVPPAFDKASNPRTKRQNTQRDARTLAAQTTSKAFKNGELDVDKFVKAREYEIRALEEGLQRSKKALTQRAFQQVPKDLRRRTASHNAARVPKRLRQRARQEMTEDNTPTVTAKGRRLTGRMRLRVETVKKLRAMGAKKRAALDKEKVKQKDEAVATTAVQGKVEARTKERRDKKNQLKQPPVPKAKFRKRQLHKSWLPTHLYHAKRAKMTPSMEPLWRFAIPLTPSLKCYRPTHRAASERGAVAWDVSYLATIRLEGLEKSIEGVLKGLGTSHVSNGPDAFGPKGRRWRNGTRTWQGWLFERDQGVERPKGIAPVTAIWRIEQHQTFEPSKTRRAVFLRVHPSAFLQLWEQVTQLCKVQRPQVVAEDLRFEIGSIEIRGPGSTEALQGALWPSREADVQGTDIATANQVWKSLNGIQDPALLPANAMLAFSIQDPRLHHPPRTVEGPTSGYEQQLLQVLADWPADGISQSQAIFDSKVRRSSSKSLPSQKAINRRKGDSQPGEYPAVLPTDPRIPVLLYVSKTTSSKAASWTVLLPWKAVTAVWYSIMYYPLSTGGQVRLGGLREQRQLAFESGTPWFPGDFPGTDAGDVWNDKESARRRAEWERRPKGKRHEFSSTDVGADAKGELGDGWACDWKRLLNGPPRSENGSVDGSEEKTPYHIDTQTARSILVKKVVPSSLSVDFSTALTTVCIEYLTRGVPSPCARVYRLPESSQSTGETSSEPSSGPTLTSVASSESGRSLREQWLSLLPFRAKQHDRTAHHELKLPVFPRNAPQEEIQRRLAAYLLSEPTSDDAHGPDYPRVPGEDDLIGFVTTGEFCLSQGKGVGIASVQVSKIMGDACRGNANGNAIGEPKIAREERQLCIVRNAGESIGRLARWEVV